MTKKCNNVHDKSRTANRLAQSRAYSGLKSITGKAGESVTVTFIPLGPGGVSL